MYSYECVFEHPKIPKTIEKKDGITGMQMEQTSVSIVADTGIQALQYAIAQIKTYQDYELVAVIRRHPIIVIIK
jgi:hypothetical protein